MKKNQAILVWGALIVGGIALYAYNKNKKNKSQKMSNASGSWGIGECQGNPQRCKEFCEKPTWQGGLGGEYLPNAGSNGGCWCSGCQGVLPSGGITTTVRPTRRASRM